jgi:hypothetical protein
MLVSSPSIFQCSLSCKYLGQSFRIAVANRWQSIGVTTRSRPAAAPQTGPYELGWLAIGHPSFELGISASATIFISSAGTSAFLPVISEMRRPKDYNKAVYVCMAIVQASYLTFSLVVYRWCGQWVANPSLGVRIAAFLLVSSINLTNLSTRAQVVPSSKLLMVLA